MKRSAFFGVFLPILGIALSGVSFFSRPTKAVAVADDYYSSIDWTQKGATLKTSLSHLIRNHEDVGYDGLWNVYKSADVRPDGKIWDMYSDQTNYVPGGSAQGKNYSKEGDSYNREHTIPQSVFKKKSPMKADAFHVYPTDGYVNNRRSTYPHADVDASKVTYSSHNGFVKIGTCSDEGISEKACEVADEYKGDFARTYFYFVTCYQDEMKNGGWGAYAPFDYSSTLGIRPAYLTVYLRWSKLDPVSPKEINRNNAVYAFQKNRNPFIDHPEAIEKIWGNGGSSGSSSLSSSSVSTSSSSISSSSQSSSPEPVVLESIRVNGSWTVPFGDEAKGDIHVEADYSDGSNKDITSLVTLPKPNNKKLGEQILTVSYQGKTAPLHAKVTNIGAKPGEVASDKEVTIQPKTANGSVSYISSDASWTASNSSSGINTQSNGNHVNLGSSKNAGSITLSSSTMHQIRQVKLAVSSFSDETPVVTCEISSIRRSVTMAPNLEEMVFDFGEGVQGDTITISNDGGKKRVQITSLSIVSHEGKEASFTPEEQANAWAIYFLANTDSYDPDVWLSLGDEYRAMTADSIAFYQANKATETFLQSVDARYEEVRKRHSAWNFQGNEPRPEANVPASSSSSLSSSSFDSIASSTEITRASEPDFLLWPIFVAAGVILLLGGVVLLLWIHHRKK